MVVQSHRGHVMCVSRCPAEPGSLLIPFGTGRAVEEDFPKYSPWRLPQVQPASFYLGCGGQAQACTEGKSSLPDPSAWGAADEGRRRWALGLQARSTST